MDYLSYYNLRSEPFSNVPLSEFYFGSKQHTDALNRLLHVARNMKGLAVLVGDVGRGKSTLARRLLEALPEEEFEAAMLVVVHNAAGPKWLLHRLAMQLGVEQPADEPLALVSQLYHRLVAIHQAGKRTVVLVDEAQMLTTREMMEEFRGLLNLEVPGHKLITFVFFGLPELEQNLKLDPPLAQRVALRYQLSALSPDETAAYVNHRLQIAGATQTLFDSDALWEVHRYSGGVPRLINTLCDNVLLEMFFGRMLKADAARVVEVATNLKLTVDGALPSKPANALPVMVPAAASPAVSALDLEELIPEPLDDEDVPPGTPVQRGSALEAFDREEQAIAVEPAAAPVPVAVAAPVAAPAPAPVPASRPAVAPAPRPDPVAARAPLFPPAPREAPRPAPSKPAAAATVPSSRMVHEFDPFEDEAPSSIPLSESPAVQPPAPKPPRPKETVLDLDAMSFDAPPAEPLFAAAAPAASAVPVELDVHGFQSIDDSEGNDEIDGIDIEFDEGQSFSGKVPPRDAHDINEDADSIAAMVAAGADETVDLPGDSWQGVEAGDFLVNTSKMQMPKPVAAAAAPAVRPAPSPEPKAMSLAARARAPSPPGAPAVPTRAPAPPATPARAPAQRPVLDSRSKNLLADVDSLLADLEPKRK